MALLIPSILAAAYTFTATATGVDKNTPLEFFLVGRNSDRDYEAMFVLDEPIEDFCRNLETAGFPRGKPISAGKCVLWPSGVTMTLEPGIDKFVNTVPSDGTEMALPGLIYTGGTRERDGKPVASENMPAALFALYDCPQSPIQFNGSFDQSLVYGWHKAKETLKKGDRRKFKLTWDEKTKPIQLELEFAPGNELSTIKSLQETAQKGEVDALVSFGDSLSVAEAIAGARALEVIDSPKVKINGVKAGKLFYRAFLPLVKWQDRQERLNQPFELTIADGSEKLVYIEEDWSGDAPDPKLTEKTISFDEAVKYPKTDTCFIYAGKGEKLSRIYSAMAKLKNSQVANWYIFATDKP
jgi:hypothetical protein